MPGIVKLEAIQGPLSGRIFSFDAHDIFIFGRSPECHACLPEDDRTASRRHFMIEVNPPDACIRDLGSLNGTFVNDAKHGGRAATESPEQAASRKYPEVLLQHQDKIRVGQTVFVVQVELPEHCCDCGREIAASEKKACEWVGGTHICPSCRAKAAEPRKPSPQPQKAADANKPPAKPQGAGELKRSLPPRVSRSGPFDLHGAPESICCKECGKDVAREVGRRRGDYICKSCQAKAEVDPAALLIRLLLEKHGRKETGMRGIPGYNIQKKLGEGGMGAVYLATRVKDNTEVALKVMLAKVAVDERAREVFQREIEVTRSLRHPNCVALYDHGSAGSAFYFALEFCPGGSLDGLVMRRGGKLSLKEAGPLMLQSLEGLSYAHSRGYVHRDLKPQNILLTALDGGRAKVADFGLAKNFSEAGLSGMTATGGAAGTIVFMAREQLINYKYVKPVSDVWSMAATFYCMLTAQMPRDFGKGKDPVEVILGQPVVPIQARDAGIPRKIAKVIDQALADEVKHRFQTAAEFHSALEKAL
jgi:hypothetical protein